MTTPIITDGARANLISRLFDWLDAHPDLPVAYVHYADAGNAELQLHTVRDAATSPTLGQVASAAEAVTDPVLSVTVGDPLTVKIVGGVDSLALILRVGIRGSARQALLHARCPAPGETCWPLELDVLRDAARTLAGA